MLTPFEESGTFSSIADSEDFLEALADAYPHVTLQRWGQPSGAVLTRLGMFTVTVGTGPVAGMVLGAIHGDEKSGREACMAFARDLAESIDPGVQEYLTRHSWSILATANPSGTMADTRQNANGVDLNRTYDDLVERETWTIDKWMKWAVPVLAVDLHEMWNSDLLSATATGTVPSDGLAALYPLGVELDGVVSDALQDAGYTYLPYSSLASGTLRRDGSARWKIVAQLVEVNREQGTLTQRVNAHRVALGAALGHHRANTAEYEAAHLAAGGTGGGALPGGAPLPADQFVVLGGVPVPAVATVIRGGVPVTLTGSAVVR